MAGWIKLHRKTLESQVFSDSELFRLWCYLLLRASFKTSWFRGVEIKRGQVAFSYRVLSDTLGYSRGKLERSMKKLESMGSIHVKAGRDFSVATVCNYEVYQSDDDSSRDANGAANGAVAESASGSVNGAVYKKEIIQESPPPTPSRFQSEGDDWAGVGEELRQLGMSRVDDAVATAQARSLSAGDVRNLIGEWLRNAGAWGHGALFQRLTGQLAAWPPPAAEFQRTKAREQSLKGHAAVVAEREAGEQRRIADAQRIANLNAKHGTTIEAMSPEQIAAAIDSPQLLAAYQSRGLTRLVRERLFEALENDATSPAGAVA